MKFQKREIIPFAIIGLMFVVAFIVEPYVQDPMITHWNSEGQADGFSDKFTGLFLIPLMVLAIYSLLQIVPKIAVYKKNIQSFYNYFFAFKVIFALFIFGIYIVSTLANLGYDIDITMYMLPAIAIFFFYGGYMMRKTKRNFFIGIKTPWTLSSDIVWHKTHQIGGNLFMLLALISVISILFPKYMIYIFIVPVVFVVVFLMVYSYYLYRKLPDKEKIQG